MNSMLELEEQDIELQLREIELKRKQLAIKRERVKEYKLPVSVPETTERKLHLHYSRSAQDNHMKIADVCPDGSIKIFHGKDTMTFSKKYNMRTLQWIANKLPSWSVLQRKETRFWKKIAAQYSKRFLKDDTISHTTMEKLCYIVDSGEMNVWFEKYDSLKSNRRQALLDGEWTQPRRTIMEVKK